MSIARVNKHFARRDIPLDLYKPPAAGYLYFTFDDGKRFETHSVMVCHFNHLSVAQWIEIGNEFLTTLETKQ